jgi:hypothetical protein
MGSDRETIEAMQRLTAKLKGQTMRDNTADRLGAGMGLIAALSFWLVFFAGWLTHLYVCFTEDRWGFLVAGALVFPIGIIHGWGRWLGAW